MKRGAHQGCRDNSPGLDWTLHPMRLFHLTAQTFANTLLNLWHDQVNWCLSTAINDWIGAKPAYSELILPACRIGVAGWYKHYPHFTAVVNYLQL
jgi:hypothetical protein